MMMDNIYMFDSTYRKMITFSNFRYTIDIFILLVIALKAYFILQSIYPFIGTADGWHRLYIAQGDDRFAVLPPLLQYIYSAFLNITGGIASFTFSQMVIFYLATYILIRELLKGLSIYLSVLVFILILFVPLFNTFPAIMTDCALVYACMAMIPTIARKSLTNNRVPLYIIIFIITTALFCLRFNAITTLPVILIALFLYKSKTKKIYIIAISLSIITTFMINKDIRSKSRPEALGMTWEIIGVIKNNKDTSISHIMDFCGNTQGAVSKYNTRSLNTIVWDSSPPLPAKCIASIEGSKKVKGVYNYIIMNYFLEWVKIKYELVSNITGWSEPLQSVIYGVNNFDYRTEKWGGVKNNKYDDVIESYKESSNTFYYIVYRPYISFILSFIVLFLVFKINRSKSKSYFFVTLLSLSYYSGFFISSQSMEFRYFSPSFYLNSFMTLTGLIVLTYEIISKIRKKTYK